MSRNDTIDEYENEHWEEEEETDGPDEVELLPERIGLRQTAGFRCANYSLSIAHDEQHRTAIM